MPNATKFWCRGSDYLIESGEVFLWYPPCFSDVHASVSRTSIFWSSWLYLHLIESPSVSAAYPRELSKALCSSDPKHVISSLNQSSFQMPSPLSFPTWKLSFLSSWGCFLLPLFTKLYFLLQAASMMHSCGYAIF